MSRLRRLSINPRVVKAALVVFVLATAVVISLATPAYADRCGTEFLYFSDGTFQEVVGIRGWLPYNCACQFYTWGTITIYKIVQDSYC